MHSFILRHLARTSRNATVQPYNSTFARSSFVTRAPFVKSSTSLSNASSTLHMCMWTPFALCTGTPTCLLAPACRSKESKAR